MIEKWSAYDNLSLDRTYFFQLLTFFKLQKRKISNFKDSETITDFIISHFPLRGSNETLQSLFVNC